MKGIKNVNNLRLLFVMLLYSVFSLGQGKIEVKKIDIPNFAKQIKFEGRITNTIRWTDNTGDNIVITTETGEYPSRVEKDEDYRDAELFAYHFIYKNQQLIQTWKVYDYEKACPLDLFAGFLRNTLQVTDLNKDGIGEVWLMYQTVCRGDVGPSQMKIIMYQGQQKFVMRGQNKVRVSDNEMVGGDYKFDSAFSSAPIFMDFAKTLWDKNIMRAGEE